MVKLVKLKEIVDLQNGYAFKSDSYVDFSNTMICRMSNIKPNIGFDINYNPKYISDDSSALYKNYLLKDNDIIIAMTDLANDPKILGVPVLVKTNGKVILQNQRVGKLIIKSKDVDASYLMRVLSTKKARDFYKKFSNGGLQINIGKKEILENVIPLPSVEEQKQIAKTLDKANELIELRKESITKLDTLAKSIFIDMFGDPVSNPKGWETILLNDIGIWKGGGTPSRTNSDYFSGDIPWITTVSLGNLYIDESNAVELITNEAISKSSTKLIPKNSIIIGTRVGVGKVSINKVGICTNQDIISITNIHKNFNNIFIVFFIKSYNEVLNTFKRGATIQGITSANLKNIDLINPPIELQNKFAKIIEKIEEQKSLYEKELEKLEENFQALLQKSFQE